MTNDDEVCIPSLSSILIAVYSEVNFHIISSSPITFMPHASHTPAECDVAKLIQSDSRSLLVLARWSDWVG